MLQLVLPALNPSVCSNMEIHQCGLLLLVILLIPLLLLLLLLLLILPLHLVLLFLMLLKLVELADKVHGSNYNPGGSQAGVGVGLRHCYIYFSSALRKTAVYFLCISLSPENVLAQRSTLLCRHVILANAYSLWYIT